MKLLQMADPVRYARMTSEELRETFLLQGIFTPERIDLAYVDLDRTVIGSAVPTVAALKLETQPELRADYFLERRELGVLNTGGPGSVSVDGVSFDLDKLDCLYVGRGSKSVTFSSKSVFAPAAFYLLSYLAHTEYPTKMVKFADLKGLELGSAETCNKRTIYKTIYRDGIGGLLLLRCRAGPARGAPDGTARRNQPPDYGGQAGGGLSGMVDPRRSWHQELRVLLGHGRRKPGLRRHGPGCHSEFEVSCRLFVVSCWLLFVGYLLVICCWLLVSGWREEPGLMADGGK
jgi:hypothetical protein